MAIKNIVIYIFIVCSLHHSFAQKKIMDNWYYNTHEDQIGYLHYLVQEDSASFYITVNLKLLMNETDTFNFSGKINTKKDKYLTVKNFEMKLNQNDRVFQFTGNVEQISDTLYWNTSHKVRKSLYPTVDSFSLWYLITVLNTDHKGIVLKYNSMEIDELNYKPNHSLYYLEDEVIIYNQKKTKTKKIILKGKGIAGSTFWIDDQNNLVKIAIDDFETKTYVLTTKDNIDKRLID